MSKLFYTNLPLQKTKISQLVAQKELFSKIPDDWYVVITDIKGSTQAVKEGRHELVNLIATGSIIAVLNLAQKAHVKIPYFFGGDGATLLIPNELLPDVLLALNEHKANTLRNFELDLRVGSVPVAQVYAAKQQLKIAKAKYGNIRNIPVILGNGLQYAESLIKSKDPSLEEGGETVSTLNLEGMECRWDRIRPPAQINEIVCLLVDVSNDRLHPQVFHQVLELIDNIYGPEHQRQPLSVQRLKLDATYGKVKRETVTKFGNFRGLYLLRVWLMLQFGNLYFRINQKGKKYLQLLVELSDTLVLDGRINTVIAGTVAQRKTLVNALEQMEEDGQLLFGIYATGESVLSCYVRDDVEQRVHFVDGSEGGYTQAAKMLKKKIAKAKTS